MSNRIVGPDGAPVGGSDSDPKKTPTMQQRLQAALDLWTEGRKDEAFATALNAMAYQSHGLAGLARLVKQLEAKLEKPPNE